jgi:hypothetical protein
MTDVPRDIVVEVDDVVVVRLAANVVRLDERLSDARAVPHWDVE